MKRQLEVIAEFTDGRVIPRKIRYYEVASARYIEKDVRELSYEIIDRNRSTFGVRFSDREERILAFSYRDGRWSFRDHL